MFDQWRNQVLINAKRAVVLCVLYKVLPQLKHGYLIRVELMI